jgi:hypothetical protein
MSDGKALFEPRVRVARERQPLVGQALDARAQEIDPFDCDAANDRSHELIT